MLNWGKVGRFLSTEKYTCTNTEKRKNEIIDTSAITLAVNVGFNYFVVNCPAIIVNYLNYLKSLQCNTVVSCIFFP